VFCITASPGSFLLAWLVPGGRSEAGTRSISVGRAPRRELGALSLWPRPRLPVPAARPAHRELREATAKPVAAPRLPVPAARPAGRCRWPRPARPLPKWPRSWPRPAHRELWEAAASSVAAPRLPVPAARPTRRCWWPRPAHREPRLRRSEPGGRAPPAGARVSCRETSRTPLAASRAWTGLWFPGILASLQFLTEK